MKVVLISLIISLLAGNVSVEIGYQEACFTVSNPLVSLGTFLVLTSVYLVIKFAGRK